MILHKNRSTFIEMQDARKLLDNVLRSYRKLVLNDELEKAELILPMLEFRQQQFSHLYIKYLRECDEHKGNAK